MGTNTFPQLVRRLSTRSLPYEAALLERLGGMQTPLVRKLGLARAPFQRTKAKHGFIALGENATNAIPGILSAGLSGEMVDSLRGIGPAGLPIVLREIASGNESVRHDGLFGLQVYAREREKVTEVWLRHTTDPSPRVRCAATVLLWAAPQTCKSNVLARLKELGNDQNATVALMAKVTAQRIALAPPEPEVTLLP